MEQVDEKINYEPWTPPGSPPPEPSPPTPGAVKPHEDEDDNDSDDSKSIHSAPEFTSSATRVPQLKEFVPAVQQQIPSSSSLDRFSLWDHLVQEVTTGDVESSEQEGIKSERVTNFLSIPGEFEVVILFGVFVCLDSFLYTFTILPLRAITAAYHALFNAVRGQRTKIAHKCDLTKMLVVVATIFILQRMTDASKMYHSVRGQETIKLYVIFNMFEIADRLCCSFGQDLQDSLYSKQTFGRTSDGSRKHVRPIVLFGLTLAYTVAHTLVLFYQLVTLNVAINSYSNALLTLLLSNQFVEIKGSVFKKFEKENLFQMTCADIVERFQLGLMLFIIALRNLIELSSASSSSLFGFLPASFASFSLSSLFSLPTTPPTVSLIQTIFSPALVVLLSECIVDWLKHAFITKFNHIRPAVYGRFIDVLSKDLVVSSGSSASHHERPFVDQSPAVARRIGFAAIPLGCLVVRVIAQAFEMLSDESVIDECAVRPPTSGLLASSSASASSMTSSATLLDSSLFWNSAISTAVVVLAVIVFWLVMAALKLTIGINLRAYATSRVQTMSLRVKEDELNDRGRPKIGLSAAEHDLDETVRKFVVQDGSLDGQGKKAGGSKYVPLEELSRYDMVRSRVW